MSLLLSELARALDAVAATRSKKAKVAALAECLRACDDVSVPVVARFVLGRLTATGETRALGVGWALLGSSASRAIGRTDDELALRSRELGDVGDALAALAPPRDATLTVADLASTVEALLDTADRAKKRTLLHGLFVRATPGEARFIAKALLGELRIGVQRGLIEEALAVAFEHLLADVRRAAAVEVDVGVLALRARNRTLGEAGVVLGRPVAFMLASPMESVKEPFDPALTVVEDKLDGIRTQAHVCSGVVTLFARGLEEVTEAFPEVVEALRAMPRDVVLDGEILAVTVDGGPRPFQALQARLGRRTPSEALRTSTPVRFVAYDVLFDGESLLTAPWTERRKHLDALPLTRNGFTPLDASAPVEPQLDAHFAAARGRGHEGLVLKRTDAQYDAGRRGSAWRKVKRALATLDCVITAAERGHGKRAHVLSDYTFAVWRGPELVDVGKAYSGLTDVEIAALTTRLEALTIDQVPGYHRVAPSIVLEVAFDGVQPSRRHRSGFALRFPRIVRVRDDKQPEQADTVQTVQALFDAQVDSGHRERSAELSFDD